MDKMKNKHNHITESTLSQLNAVWKYPTLLFLVLAHIAYYFCANYSLL